MASAVFNVSKGRVGELYNRVVSNDPANSALIVVALKAAGLEAQATLKDYDTLAAILAGANDEATNIGYLRKTLTNAELAAMPAPDDANNRYDFDLPDLLWTAVQAAGGAWGALVLCYDPDTTSGTDATIIPLVVYDAAVTPDGTNISVTINTAGFFRAE